MQDSLKPFFIPDSVAVIGASKNPDKLSHGIVKNLLAYGYAGAVYPVNPKEEEILGLKCYPGVLDIDNAVDLAVIILPVNLIPRVVEDCGRKGIKGITVISGGFKEIGAGGADKEKELLNILDKYKMRMIGPNCVGTLNLITGLNTTFIKGMPSKGGIGFISQSGAVCGGIVDYIAHQGIGFSHFLSLGNEADVTETDMIEYLGDDPQTKVIAAYIEGINDGNRFIRIGKKVTSKKPVLILKAGKSEEGAKAVSSHTGSLAGSHAAYQAAFRQAGMVEVSSLPEMLNCAAALDWLQQPRGNRAVIVTNSGGPAAIASDSFSEHGIQLADLSAKTKQQLTINLNPSAQVANPVDMLGGASEDEYAHALATTLNDKCVDMALTILVPTSLVDPVKIAEAISAATSQSVKPVVVCLIGHASIQEARAVLQANKIPVIEFPSQAGVVFNALLSQGKEKKSVSYEGISMPGKAKEQVSNMFKSAPDLKIWGEHHTRPILDAYGIQLIKGELVKNEAEAVRVANKIGYPVVVKGASQDVLHKSDARAVLVDIKDDAHLQDAYRQINENIRKKYPGALLDGMLIEKMAPEGEEVIIGMKRDPTFGPVMMFGMGGIFVELFSDVAFRIAPLEREDVRAMIKSTKAFQLLNAWRGGPVYDIQTIEDAIIRISQLSCDFKSISEIEINPFRVYEKGQGAEALDCRMILA